MSQQNFGIKVESKTFYPTSQNSFKDSLLFQNNKSNRIIIDIGQNENIYQDNNKTQSETLSKENGIKLNGNKFSFEKKIFVEEGKLSKTPLKTEKSTVKIIKSKLSDINDEIIKLRKEKSIQNYNILELSNRQKQKEFTELRQENNYLRFQLEDLLRKNPKYYNKIFTSNYINNPWNKNKWINKFVHIRDYRIKLFSKKKTNEEDNKKNTEEKIDEYIKKNEELKKENEINNEDLQKYKKILNIKKLENDDLKQNILKLNNTLKLTGQKNNNEIFEKNNLHIKIYDLNEEKKVLRNDSSNSKKINGENNKHKIEIYDLKNHIENYKNKNKEYNIIEEYKREINELKKKLEEHNYDKNNKNAVEIKELKNLIGKIKEENKREIENYIRKINNFKKIIEDNNKLINEEKNNRLKEINKYKKIIEENNENIKKKEEEFNKQINELNKINEEIKLKKIKEKNNCDNEINELKKIIEENKNNNNKDIQQLKEEIKQIKEEKDKYLKENNELKKIIEDNRTIIEENNQNKKELNILKIKYEALIKENELMKCSHQDIKKEENIENEKMEKYKKDLNTNENNKYIDEINRLKELIEENELNKKNEIEINKMEKINSENNNVSKIGESCHKENKEDDFKKELNELKLKYNKIIDKNKIPQKSLEKQNSTHRINEDNFNTEKYKKEIDLNYENSNELKNKVQGLDKISSNLYESNLKLKKENDEFQILLKEEKIKVNALKELTEEQQNKTKKYKLIAEELKKKKRN